jgi:hypothetical protein
VRVARRSPSYATNINDAELYFSLLDDWGYGINGYPNVNQGRQGRYTCAYMLRRTQSSAPDTTEVTVIVYAGRPVDVPTAETAYTVNSGAVGGTSVVLSYAVGGDRPEVRRGRWLFDITPSASGRAVNAQFYRVMDVTETGNAGELQLEVQPPLRYAPSQMVLLVGAVDVFERGIGK